MGLKIMANVGEVKPLGGTDWEKSDLYKDIESCVDALMRNPEAQIAKCTEAIRLNPDDAMEYVSRGLVYECMNDFDMAIADYSAAIRLDPAGVLYYSRGDMYLRKGDTEQAIADYTEAIRLDPDFADAYFNRGCAYNRKGNYDQAIADYTKTISLDTDYKEAYANRSAVWATLGLCPFCGGELDGTVTKKCKSCGEETQDKNNA